MLSRDCGSTEYAPDQKLCGICERSRLTLTFAGPLAVPEAKVWNCASVGCGPRPYWKSYEYAPVDDRRAARSALTRNDDCLVGSTSWYHCGERMSAVGGMWPAATA